MTAPPDCLLLDDRQRAMLREMGVQVWQPRSVPSPVPVPEAPVTVAAITPVAPAPTVAAPRAAAATPPAPPAPRLAADAPQAVLRGDWQAMFPATGDDADGPVWLLLADSATADLQAGDAGRLLLAMLRAAGLHKGAQVWGAAVGRPGEDGLPLAEALAQAVDTRRPRMVLAMGRLAAQAALGRAEPLGRLRGAVHAVAGVPLVVSYEAAYLLRAQDDKARAWEDLCRALAAARAPHP